MQSSLRILWACLPLHLVMNVAAVAIFSARGRAGTISKAKLDARSGLGAAWRKRRMRQAQRKIVVLPHGIYTITYRRGKGGRLDACIQKGRRVEGRIVTRAVHLGPAAALTKAKLWQRSLALERKLAGFLEEATGNLGRINESRQVMFGVI